MSVTITNSPSQDCYNLKCQSLSLINSPSQDCYNLNDHRTLYDIQQIIFQEHNFFVFSLNAVI